MKCADTLRLCSFAKETASEKYGGLILGEMYIRGYKYNKVATISYIV
jgi:hypothetical protein